jgi:hypothetical protein
MVPVFRCSDYLQAQLLAGLLRQHGIDAYLQGAYLQGGVGELPAIGQLVIMVDEDDRSAAERILGAYERGELAIREDEPHRSGPLHACGGPLMDRIIKRCVSINASFARTSCGRTGKRRATASARPRGQNFRRRPYDVRQ